MLMALASLSAVISIYFPSAELLPPRCRRFCCRTASQRRRLAGCRHARIFTPDIDY
jgi:hypothetical protein